MTKKMGYIYTMEYYSSIIQNKMTPFAATWMELEIIMVSEVSQKEKDKYQCYHLYVESKIWDKWTYLWRRNRLTDIEDKLVNSKGWWGEVGWEFGVSRCKLLHIEQINNKVSLQITGNYIQYPVINHNVNEYFLNVYTYITELLCCTVEINTS